MRIQLPLIGALCLYTTLSALAGTTGKIAGTVTDASTGQPLPGVNVIIEGTTMGAATDATGHYFIINVPVGVYVVKATMIGYTAVRVTDVRVSVDITTEVNFQLQSEVIELGKEVVVTAERPLILKDVTSTQHFVGREVIEELPLDNFQQMAALQPGVVGSNFRGGRLGESIVFIDGVPVKNPTNAYIGFNSGFSSDIPELSIAEMEVITGAFAAEYGNVQSGILNIVTKEGSGKFSGRLRAKASDYFLRTERFNYFGNPKGHLTPILRNYEATLSGPILKGPVGLTYFVSGELMDQPRGFLPNQQAKELSFQGKLSLRFSANHKLLLSGLGDHNTWDTFSNYYAKYGPRSEGYPFDRYERVLADSTLERYIFVTDPENYRDREVAESGYWTSSDGRKLYYKRVREFYQAGMLDHRADNTNKSNQQSVIWTHTLSKQTYYEIKLGRFFSHFRQAVKDVDDRDKDGNTDEELYWRNNGKLNPDGTLSPLSHRNILDEVGYWNFTGDQGVWIDQKATSWSARVDLTSQVTKHHLIKVGAEAAWNQGAVEKATWESVDKVREDIWDQDALDLALYVQDKIEFEGLIVNAGLRFDHFDPNGLRDPVLFPRDLKNLSTADLVSLRGLKKAKRRSQLSPRIGISHPITERDVLHFSYGHFFQRPDTRYLYENIGLNTSYATNIDFGNPNLKPEKTVSYEIGLNHLFTNDVKGTVTAYFKDITNLVDQAAYLTTDGYLVYEAFANADYANARGLEFSLEKRVGAFWGGTVNYAWAFAKGRSSSAFAAGTDLIPRRLDPLSWDIRHRVNANLIFRTPSRLGRWLGDWYFDAVYQFATGTPYSSSAGKGIFVLLAPRNDARLPSRHRVDLRVRKRFAVMSFNPTLFIETLNLLNRRNVDYIADVDYYERTGDPSGFFKNPDVYSNPRTVRFGVELYW